MARELKREKSRKIQFANSERVLYEFSKDQQSDLFKHNGEQKENLRQSVMAARGFQDWRSFAMCGYKHSQEPTQRDKRLSRYMLIGQAIDAFEDVPKEPKGFQFLKNDWGQGPFYAWDPNFL